jgi:predicted nuclease of predicted toxin-antitoxin system
MRLLIDMNLSPRWVEAFNEAGIEAVPAHPSSD